MCLLFGYRPYDLVQAAGRPCFLNIGTPKRRQCPACKASCKPADEAQAWHSVSGTQHVSQPPCFLSALQETLDNLRKAMRNTRIMCAVMLDTKVRS